MPLPRFSIFWYVSRMPPLSLSLRLSARVSITSRVFLSRECMMVLFCQPCPNIAVSLRPSYRSRGAAGQGISSTSQQANRAVIRGSTGVLSRRPHPRPSRPDWSKRKPSKLSPSHRRWAGPTRVGVGRKIQRYVRVCGWMATCIDVFSHFCTVRCVF